MLLTTPVSAETSAASEVVHTTLSNGLEVVVIPDHRAPVVTHMVWYKVGAADEPRGESGIAHFLEHLMFKGTDKIAPGEFSKIIARNGGEDNAFTTQDTTAYFQRVSADRLRLAMGMEADRMENLRLKPDDVTNELKVVLEERRMRVDNEPSSILSEQMAAVLFLAHPYGTPVIGWANEVKNLTREDAVAFYKRYYAPNNAILVIAGDVQPEAVVAMAKEIFGGLKPSETLPPRKRLAEPEPVAARRVVLKDERVAKDTLSREYLTPCYTTAKGHEAEALDLLSTIMGAESTGRLYKKLVIEEKKASAAGAWYSGDALDYGRFGLYAVSGNDTSLADIEASANEVIADIRKNGVTAGELERARNSKVAELIYGRDSQSNQARTYGWALATGRTVADVQDEANRLEAVTLADIQTVAKKYLDPKRSVTGELLSVSKAMASNGAPAPMTAPPGLSDTLH